MKIQKSLRIVKIFVRHLDVLLDQFDEMLLTLINTGSMYGTKKSVSVPMNFSAKKR